MELEELKIQMYQVKRQNQRLKNENEMLKVKVRKLEDSMNAKHRLIDNLIDPKKSSHFRQGVSEHGASYIILLKEQNEKLREELRGKTFNLKKLQSELDSAKAYLNKSKASILSTKSAKLTPQPKSAPKVMRRAVSEDRDRKRSGAHMHIISRRASPSPKLKPGEGSDTPHEEIQTLHNYFNDIVTEVQQLKESIFQIQKVQHKTSSVLEEKESNIEKLTLEVKKLKKKKDPVAEAHQKREKSQERTKNVPKKVDGAKSVKRRKKDDSPQRHGKTVFDDFSSSFINKTKGSFKNEVFDERLEELIDVD